MATPVVSVIIPHLNDIKGLDLCLSALGKQDFDRRFFEIVVVDNGSACGRSLVEACIGGRARLVHESQRGAGPSRNRGVEEARGHILAFTDADCVPRKDWLRRGIAQVTKDNFVGGEVIVTSSVPAKPSVAEAYELAFAFDVVRYALKKQFVPTANLFVTKETFVAVGQFDSAVSEDTDWCWRAIKAGYRLTFDPNTAIEHPARDTEAALFTKQQRVTRERFYLAMRWGSSRKMYAVRAIAALAMAPRELIRVRRVPISYWPQVMKLHLRLRYQRCYQGIRLCLDG